MNETKNNVKTKIKNVGRKNRPGIGDGSVGYNASVAIWHWINHCPDAIMTHRALAKTIVGPDASEKDIKHYAASESLQCQLRVLYKKFKFVLVNNFDKTHKFKVNSTDVVKCKYFNQIEAFIKFIDYFYLDIKADGRVYKNLTTYEMDLDEACSHIEHEVVDDEVDDEQVEYAKFDTDNAVEQLHNEMKELLK